MYILYIEDEPNDASLVKRYCQASGYQLQIASTLDEARAAMVNNPDVILVDLLLNQTREGYDFVNELREEGYQRPVIAITALSLPAEIDRCYRVGCDDVITKPYVITQLADTLNKYLS